MGQFWGGREMGEGIKLNYLHIIEEEGISRQLILLLLGKQASTVVSVPSLQYKLLKSPSDRVLPRVPRPHHVFKPSLPLHIWQAEPGIAARGHLLNK